MSTRNTPLNTPLPVAPFPSRRLNRWAEIVWRVAGSVDVRTKILGMVLALTTVLGLAVTLQVRAVMTRIFAEELESRGVSVASDLASRSIDPILLNDTYALHQLLRETVSNHPDALYAFVTDNEGQVLAHTFGDAGFPAGLLDAATLKTATFTTHGDIRHWVYTSNEGIVHEMIAPIMGGGAGVVRLGLTETRLQAVVNTVTGQMILTTLLVALAGIVAAMLLTWLLTRPILDLVETTQEVGRGNLQARAPHWADDEIGALADAFNQMVSDLDASRRAVAEKEQARFLLLKKLISAQEEERKRIARELHDGVGQMLTSLMVGMRTLQRRDEGDLASHQMDELCATASETLEQVRTLSRELRPSLLDDLGLAAALERYVGEFDRAHPDITVDLHCDLPARLPGPVETALYRIVQEAMTNAARHGKASAISVLVSRRANTVQAIVEDNGVGFDVEAVRRRQSSVGIFGMTERAELLGGRLELESSSEGATVYVEIPL
ncbi:MAG TPA: HAMP domain-containing protein [Chloroflexi bacterium]|nr:HAMP domain-containing protein [Chloroflexota bacterium]